MAKRIIKTDYSPYHTGAKAVLYDDGSYVNYDPDENVVDSTTVDDDTLDRETWSYNQNEYANRYSKVPYDLANTGAQLYDKDKVKHGMFVPK